VIGKAYQILSDSRERKKYDKKREEYGKKGLLDPCDSWGEAFAINASGTDSGSSNSDDNDSDDSSDSEDEEEQKPDRFRKNNEKNEIKAYIQKCVEETLVEATDRLVAKLMEAVDRNRL
jgi:DnaJ-class molecular chaperone